MRYIIFIIFLLVSKASYSQNIITTNFWHYVKLNRDNKQIEKGMNYWLLFQAQQISNESYSKALKRLENIENEKVLQDFSCLNLYTQYGKNKENLRIVLKSLCGSYKIANPFSDWVIKKYSNDPRALKRLNEKNKLILEEEEKKRNENESNAKREIEEKQKIEKEMVETMKNYKPIGKSQNDTILPSFNGGEIAFLKYISENLKYPSTAQESNIEGNVIVRFTVNKKGEIDNVKTIKELGFGCDQEAERVIRNIPNMLPATLNNLPIIYQMEIPINFGLGSE